MIQNLTPSCLNCSVTFLNTVNDRTMTISPGDSDLSVVAGLCTNYNFFVIGMILMTLTFLLFKIILYRYAQKNSAPWMKKMHSSADDLIDTALIFLCVIQLGVALFNYFG